MTNLNIKALVAALIAANANVYASGGDMDPTGDGHHSPAATTGGASASAADEGVEALTTAVAAASLGGEEVAQEGKFRELVAAIRNGATLSGTDNVLSISAEGLTVKPNSIFMNSSMGASIGIIGGARIISQGDIAKKPNLLSHNVKVFSGWDDDNFTFTLAAGLTGAVLKADTSSFREYLDISLQSTGSKPFSVRVKPASFMCATPECTVLDESSGTITIVAKAGRTVSGAPWSAVYENGTATFINGSSTAKRVLTAEQLAAKARFLAGLKRK